MCFLMLLASVFTAVAQDYDPVANPEAVVQSGNMRFTVLTSRMIRIQWSSTKKWEDRATFAIVNRNLPVPEYTTETSGGYLYIRTADLTLRYFLGSTPKASDNSPKNLQITFQMNGQTVTWYPGKGDEMNLMGTNRTLDRVWGDTHRGDLEKGLLSRSGWSIIDESPRTTRGDGSTTFALENTEDGFPWVAQPADKDATDWYFLGYGHNYTDALYDFTQVGGRVPMPPKYILGYWYSRYWAYSQNDFIRMISDVELNDIPMDVMIMDMDWHKSGWTGWSWNKNLIPNPTYLIDYFHKHGLKTALNLHPADGVANYEDGYSKMASELGVTGGATIPWKLEDYDFYKSFFKNIMRVREKEGVDFWWLDWQQWLTSPYTEGLSETFWCNHVYYEDMRLNRTDKRPVIYHRWGGLGSHRYPISFSGDTYATWSTLAYEIPFTSTASNVCYTYWGHDLGGHQGGNNDPELLQRWLQFGVFTPIFRTHATNDSKLERRIWKYSNFKQLRETVRLRYRLFPYLYTAARQTYETGVGVTRPLYYAYPEDQNAYTYEDEFMFGDHILVAPIYTPSVDGLSERTIWLPKGLWWDVTHRQLKQGDYTHKEKFTTDEYPYYYKAGSVIVNYPTQRTVEHTPDTIVLQVVPGADGEGRFYEDDGNNQGYQGEQWADTYMHQQWTEGQVTLTIDARKGTYPGIPTKRAWKLNFLGQTEAPTSVTLNGVPVDEAYIQHNADLQQTTVVIPTTACTEAQVVVLESANAMAEAVNQPDGESQPVINVPNESVKGQLWITGSAVPGETQMLESFPDGTFRFHGTLYPGELYIATTETKKATTRYCKPVISDANVVTTRTAFTQGYNTSNAAWMVTHKADNYRFTVDPATLTLAGEQFIWWYEAWIVGGCTAPGQTGSWTLDKGLAMEQNPNNPYEWTFVGYLQSYAENSEANRFKINGQYDWGPKTLRPFSDGQSVLVANKSYYCNPKDYKWTITEDGYYRICINCFLETISGEYLGKTLPVGVEETLQDNVPAEIFNLQGMRVGRGQLSEMHLPTGVYVVRQGGRTRKLFINQ